MPCGPIQFVPNQYKNQEKCDEVFNICPFVFNYVGDYHIFQKMRDKVVSKGLFMLKYCPNKYKTQAVDSSLMTLEFVPGWFVANKMIEKLDNSIFSNDNIIFPGVDFLVMISALIL